MSCSIRDPSPRDFSIMTLHIGITKFSQTYCLGKIPVRWLLQFSDVTYCSDDNCKEDTVLYKVCVHQKNFSTLLYCCPYEACHCNSTRRRKVIEPFYFWSGLINDQVFVKKHFCHSIRFSLMTEIDSKLLECQL